MKVQQILCIIDLQGKNKTLKLNNFPPHIVVPMYQLPIWIDHKLISNLVKLRGEKCS